MESGLSFVRNLQDQFLYFLQIYVDLPDLDIFGLCVYFFYAFFMFCYIFHEKTAHVLLGNCII